MHTSHSPRKGDVYRAVSGNILDVLQTRGDRVMICYRPWIHGYREPHTIQKTSLMNTHWYRQVDYSKEHTVMTKATTPKKETYYLVYGEAVYGPYDSAYDAEKSADDGCVEIIEDNSVGQGVDFEIVKVVKVGEVKSKLTWSVV